MLQEMLQEMLQKIVQGSNDLVHMLPYIFLSYNRYIHTFESNKSMK